MERIKKKRLRLGEYHSWSKNETELLVDFVIEAVGDNPKKFEKPISRIFYEQHCKKGLLQDIDWRLMKSKMRYLQVLFFKATEWLNNVGAELFESDIKHINSRLNTICPYYDKVKIIFECRLPTTTDPIKVPAEKPLFCLNNQNNNCSKENFFKTETDFEDSCTRSENVFLHEEEEKEESEEERACTPNTVDVLRNVETTNTQIEELWDLNREKFKLEKNKFKFECEREKERMHLQRLQINIEKAKLEFEKQKFHENLKLRKYEMDKNFELKKLELEKSERCQRLELEYKYKIQTNNEFLQKE